MTAEVFVQVCFFNSIWVAGFCRMAGRLLSRVTRSSYLLAARSQIRQDHATALPAALRDEYYPKLGMSFCMHVTVCSNIYVPMF